MQLDQSPTSTLGLRTPLRVQNMEPNVTVFAKPVDGDLMRINFQPHGMAGDTQRVPLKVAEDIDFLNSLEHGTLKVVDGPREIVEALQFETEQVRAEREADARRATAQVLDRRQDRDIVGAQCLGPAPAGREGTCGRSVLQSAQQQKEVPPLCSEHVSLAPSFYLAVAGSRGDGATETRDGVVRHEWRKVTLTERQRAQQ